VPWSEMTAKDIINWPENVKVKQVQNMDAKDLQILHKLAKKGKLDFSSELVRRISSRRTQGFNKLRSDITKYLSEKLAEKLNVNRIKVPWSKMKAEDIINWPENVEFKSVQKMGVKDLKILNQLAKKDQLDFSSEFLKQSTGLQYLNNARRYQILPKRPLI
jgi:hypothetical protein